MDAILLKRLSATERAWIAGRPAERRVGPPVGGGLLARWLPHATPPIELRVRWYDGERTVEALRPLAPCGADWRLRGAPLGGRRLRRAEPGDLCFVLLDRTVDVTGQERGLVTIDVLVRGEEREAARLAAHLLEGRARGVVHGRPGERLLGLLRQELPAFGGGRHWAVDGISERDWKALRAWLVKHVRVPALRSLLEDRAAGPVRTVLDALGQEAPPARRQELAEEVIRSFGLELLSEPERRRILAAERFRGQKARPAGVRVWVRGGASARRFVRAMGLPAPLVGQPVPPEAPFEDLTPFPRFGPLHDYQRQIAAGLREALRGETGAARRAVVWLPTGTGKTRVCVETLLMEAFLAPPRNCILWVADREELCEQAIATFRHVWMVRGQDTPSARGNHLPTLRVVRLWGGRPWQDPPRHPTLVVASIQTLARRIERRSFAEKLAELGARCAAVVFDEAHHVVAPSYGRVLRALGLGRQRNALGRDQRTGPTLVGLTATPARAARDETEQLSRRFRGRLLEPDPPFRSLEGFIEGGYLARPRLEVVETGYALERNDREALHWERYRSLPRGTLRRAGADPKRTAAIVADLEPRLERLDSVLVFACSVEHAETLAEVLARRGFRAMALHGGSPRAVRQGVIRRFRERSLQVLVTCELLATGFDAPNVDAVVLARPTGSRVLFAQMIGRGLRGPRNGGTEECLILDYEDASGPYADLDALRLAFRRDFEAASR